MSEDSKDAKVKVFTGADLGEEQAYPRAGYDGIDRCEGSEDGLTKREAFAKAAMQGLCSDRDEAGVLVEKGGAWIADQAVKCADALLEALARDEK